MMQTSKQSNLRGGGARKTASPCSMLMRAATRTRSAILALAATVLLAVPQPALALDPIPDGPPSGPLNLHIPPHKSAPKSPNTTVIEREGKTGLPSLRLVALLTGDGQQIDEGLVWRIFQSTGPTGKAKLVLESHEATPLVKLQPGDYTVNAAFGRECPEFSAGRWRGWSDCGNTCVAGVLQKGSPTVLEWFDYRLSFIR